MGRARAIATLFILGSITSLAAAQETWDAHAVAVDAYTPGQVPQARVLGGRRMVFASPGATRCEQVAEYGRMDGVERLELTRPPRGRLRIEVRYRRSRRGMSSMSRGIRRGPLTWKISPDMHGRPATFLLIHPSRRSDEPLAPWSVRDAVSSATSWLVRGEQQGAELNFLARLPLAHHLDLQDREALLDHLERANIPEDVESQAQARAVRLLAGDVDSARTWKPGDWRGRLWMGNALGISFSLARDPELKGFYGWRAVEDGEQLELVTELATAIESGAAVLPGEPEIRAQRTREILDLASFSRVTWPLIGVGLCAAGMIALVLALRAAGRALT